MQVKYMYGCPATYRILNVSVFRPALVVFFLYLVEVTLTCSSSENVYFIPLWTKFFFVKFVYFVKVQVENYIVLSSVLF